MNNKLIILLAALCMTSVENRVFAMKTEPTQEQKVTELKSKVDESVRQLKTQKKIVAVLKEAISTTMFSSDIYKPYKEYLLTSKTELVGLNFEQIIELSDSTSAPLKRRVPPYYPRALLMKFLDPKSIKNLRLASPDFDKIVREHVHTLDLSEATDIVINIVLFHEDGRPRYKNLKVLDLKKSRVKSQTIDRIVHTYDDLDEVFLNECLCLNSKKDINVARKSIEERQNNKTVWHPPYEGDKKYPSGWFEYEESYFESLFTVGKFLI